MRLVLQKLCKFNLYMKLSKYIFNVVEIEFLRFIQYAKKRQKRQVLEHEICHDKRSV